MIEDPSLMRREGNRPFLPQVESLRGFAAICVAYAHCGHVLAFPDPVVTALDRASNHILDLLGWGSNGRAAVIVFFVISGLVLSMGLDSKAGHPPVRTWCGFMLRRALRIYPAHIVSILLFVPFAYLLFRIPVADPDQFRSVWVAEVPWVNGAAWLRIIPIELVETLALVDNYYNPVVWTLKVELIGSLLLPIFALLSRRGSLGRDLLILGLLIAGACLVDVEARPDLFLLYLPAFYLGCMTRTHGRRLVAAIGRSRRNQSAAIALFYHLLVVPSALLRYDQFVVPVIVSMSAAGFGLVSLVAWGDMGPRNLLLRPAARWAGRLSYSFYLWHALIMFAFTRLVFALVEPDLLGSFKVTVLIVTVLATMGGAFIAAYVSWRWIERPFIALGRRGRAGAARGSRPAIARAAPGALKL